MATQRTIGFCCATLLIAGCAGAPPVKDETPAVIEAPTEPEPQAAPPVRQPAPEDYVVSIAAVGDMMIGTDFPDNRLPDDDAIGFLAGVTPVLAAADITFGNIEGVLMDGGEPAKKCSNPKACYLFRSPTRYAQRFADAGFDVVSFANNHARDFGEEGRTSSMQAVANLGIRHSGRVGDVASWRHGDLRIAMIAFAVTRNSNMMLDIVDAATEVGALAADHDIVIVSFHGGAEGLGALHVPFEEETYYNEPRGDVVLFARTMVDAGADLLLGHGPHVVRGIERYKDRLIAYSLGNFATYYGISVAGLKGIAPILTVRVDGDGTFLGGDIVSTVQRRPGGPVIDSERRALKKIRDLSLADFVDPGVEFSDDGAVNPTPRQFLRTHVEPPINPVIQSDD
ncbi:MAG: CapA family protein [Woeseiaceae bacterium]